MNDSFFGCAGSTSSMEMGWQAATHLALTLLVKEGALQGDGSQGHYKNRRCRVHGSPDPAQRVLAISVPCQLCFQPKVERAEEDGHAPAVDADTEILAPTPGSVQLVQLKRFVLVIPGLLRTAMYVGRCSKCGAVHYTDMHWGGAR